MANEQPSNRDARSPEAAETKSTEATASQQIDHCSMIGDYRIVRKLGSGGMGVVYEAEQQRPKRRVALKVIHGGRFVDEHQVKLFEREAQALARLKHPGIAAIYESGRTGDGQHFFAMELVRGETVSDYLARTGAGKALTPAQLRERLAIFRKIADAVTYAHQRGVIHRDLKPPNIIVERELEGSDPQHEPKTPGVKILDFGLARITETDLAVATVGTEIGMIQGTLPYMSPEQVRGNPDEIDVRSDVYSLGVILYEMISGRRPYDVHRVMLHEAVRMICEARPEPLSKSWSGTRRLDHDLETIVGKALEKQAAHRYQSVSALGDDVSRFLTGQPILARPPSAIYQVRKLVVRHKTTFAFATSLALLVVAFAITMTVQSARIARERDKAIEAEKAATQVSSFLVDIFRTADPSRTRGSTITAREILDRGAAQIKQGLSPQPLMQARLMDTLGQVYDSLGLFSQAQPLLETSLETRRRLLGDEHVDIAASLSSNSFLWFHKGDFAKAKPMVERALAMNEKLLGPEDLAVAGCLNDLGALHFVMGTYDEGRPLLARALQIREKKLPPDDPDTANTVNGLAAIAYRKGEWANARQLWERTLAMRERTLGPDHPHVAQSLNNLALVHAETGDPQGAPPLLERVVGIHEKTLGPKHPDLAFACGNLGYAYIRLGDYARGRDWYQRAVDILEVAAPAHPELGRFLAGLGRAYAQLGDVRKARTFCSRSLEIRQKAFGNNHPEIVGSLVGLANCDRLERRYASAEALFERALGFCRRPNGQYYPTAADFLYDYTILLRETGRVAQAEEMGKVIDSLRKTGSGSP